MITISGPVIHLTPFQIIVTIGFADIFILNYWRKFFHQDNSYS